MPNYQVVWAVDIEADGPGQAAQKAWEQVRDTPDEGGRSWFDVFEGDTYTRRADKFCWQVAIDEFGGVVDAD